MAGDQFHPTFAVLTNRYRAVRHSNHYRCDCCGRLASTVNLGGTWVCSGCLEQGREALAREVLRETTV